MKGRAPDAYLQVEVVLKCHRGLFFATDHQYLLLFERLEQGGQPQRACGGCNIGCLSLRGQWVLVKDALRKT